MLQQTLVSCLQAFEPCFRARSYQRFTTLMSGWLLCVGQHTVTGLMRSAGVTHRDHSGYHRFFSRGAWAPEAVGLVVLSLTLKLVGQHERVHLTLDDTLARHTGKRIAGAGMHRDPLLSTGRKPFFHFGHNWVVLAVVVTLPWGKSYSLPFLVRLYRSVKTAQKEGVAHLKKTEIAAEMLSVLGKQLPTRRFLLLVDNAYVNSAIVRKLPANMELLGRGRMDAALYWRPTKLIGRGRPRVKGERAPSPAQLAAKGRWKKVMVSVYGERAQVRIKVVDALWYKVGGGREMRFVLIRDWPGHKKDDVLATTDLSLDAEFGIEAYCQRWTLEETFGWSKSRLGLEHPNNRASRAVERTSPMALWAYSLVICWYAQWAKNRTVLPMRHAPWYRGKTVPSFADMLAKVRRECWTVWISDHARKGRLDQKTLAPLLDVAGYG